MSGPGPGEIRLGVDGPIVPNSYPYVDTNPRARCWLWFHEKAIVRTVNGDRVERYDCRCGKFYWLSQADGRCS